MSLTASLKATLVTMMSGGIPSSIIHMPKDPLYIISHSIKCFLYKTRNIDETIDNLMTNYKKLTWSQEVNQKSSHNIFPRKSRQGTSYDPEFLASCIYLILPPVRNYLWVCFFTPVTNLVYLYRKALTWSCMAYQ